MITLPGYTITKLIFDHDKFLVYQGHEEASEKTVFIKILKENEIDEHNTAELRHEFHILKKLEGHGSLKAYALEKNKDSVALIMESFSPLSLKDYLHSKPADFKTLFLIAAELVKTLHEIHKKGYILLNISPENILINEQNYHVKYINLTRATSWCPAIPSPLHLLHATDIQQLIYCAPEQIVQMNCELDERTDFYSLGIIFYQLATGISPSSSITSAELIYKSITRLIIAPSTINQRIRPIISEMIMKLIAQFPENRYQSSAALYRDIKKGLKQLEETGTIVPFPVSFNLPSEYLRISNKMYGREKEIELLQGEFNLIHDARSRLLLIQCNESGIGKKAFVQQIMPQLIEKRGYFIYGKYDKYSRNIPYSGLSQALNDLIQQILAGSDSEIKDWQNRIKRAVGTNGNVILEVIPSLFSLIGEQPPVAELSLAGAKNRFNLVLLNFINALANKNQPLILCLDNLQWADNSSLKILENILMHPESENILIIFLYQDSEDTETQLMQSTINLLKKAGSNVATVTLSPMSVQDITMMLADTLRLSDIEVEALAKICYDKSQGNPLYVQELLKTLNARHLLYYNTEGKFWYFNKESIEAAYIPNDIIQLIIEKVRYYSPQTQAIIKYAACLGFRFDLNLLATITNTLSSRVAELLWEVIEGGILVPQDELYLYDSYNNDSQLNLHYRFTHEYGHQAVLTIIEENEKENIHLKIARHLLKSTPEENLNDKVLDIVNHYNFAIKIVTNLKEKSLIAKLNFIAGKKTKAAVAYKSALVYFKLAIDCITKDSWYENYEDTLQLYREAAEAAYLASEVDDFNKYSEIVLKNATNLYDKLKIYELQIHHLSDQTKFIDAIDIEYDVLKMLGMRFPKKANLLHVLTQFIFLQMKLSFRKIEDLATLPELKQTDILAKINFLSTGIAPAYLTNPRLFQLMVFKIVNYSIKYGISDQAAFGFGTYAIILFALNKFDAAAKFGQLAAALLEKMDNESVKPKVIMILCSFVNHWREHVDINLPKLMNGVNIALETGDIDYVGFLCSAYTSQLFLTGRKLNASFKEFDKLMNLVLSLNLKGSHLYISTYLQAIANLINKDGVENVYLLKGKYFNEQTALLEMTVENDNVNILNIYLLKMILAYIFNEYEYAAELPSKADFFAKRTIGMYLVPAINFYSSLIYLANCDKGSRSKVKKLLKLVKANQSKMKLWSKYAPMNYLHKYSLVQAELYRVNGNTESAAKFYDQAIDLARKNRYLFEEAIANELAAKFYISHAKEKIAKIYINDAIFCYAKWGAQAKVKQLEKTYPTLVVSSETKELIHETMVTRPLAESLDLTTVMKASEAISREIELSNLLKNMMHIVIENAGAQKGMLLLKTNDEWLIEAESSIDSDQVTVLQSLSMKNRLPASIIETILSKKTSVVLDDAVNDEQFSYDPYVQEYSPKSVLAIPLLKQEVIYGIVYLENNLIIGAFTQDRVNLLNMLSSQIVIAIENAKLYNHRKELNVAYQRFVPYDFLKLLEKENIIDVKLGDQVHKDMTILFCNVQSFYVVTEKMTSQEMFNFLNNYFALLEPLILENNGFIDKYIGSTIMAIFKNADDAIHCAIDMLNKMAKYNKEQTNKKLDTINIEIGINSGMLTLGAVGDEYRMEETVISDVVNTASRVLKLNDIYKVPLIITGNTYDRMYNPALYSCRLIDKLLVKGKSIPITIYEVFNSNTEQQIHLKYKTQVHFEQALQLFQNQEYKRALEIFTQIHGMNPEDNVISYYIERCKKLLRQKKSLEL